MDPQVPTVEATPAPVEPPSPTSPVVPKTNWAISILFLVLGILIGIGGLWGYQNYFATKIGSTPLASPEPTATAGDPTANWKTYTNSKYGYLFKYPETWKEVSNCKFGSVCFASENFKEKVICSTCEAGILGVSGSLFSVSTSLATKDIDLNIFCHQGGPFFISSCVDSTLGGNKSKTLVDVNPVEASDEYATTTVTLFDKNLIRVSQYYDSLENKKVLDQILSTFKFIGPTSSPLASPVACTQEAKLCPDGTSVGRTGPNCEFAPCPTP